jgi:hypothetical protein
MEIKKWWKQGPGSKHIESVAAFGETQNHHPQEEAWWQSTGSTADYHFFPNETVFCS